MTPALTLLPMLPVWRFFRPAELRIDVDPRKAKPTDTLVPVHERMRAMGERLRDMPPERLHSRKLRTFMETAFQ